MRYIDISLLEKRDDGWPPDGWEARARKAREDLKNLPADEKRADFFKTHSTIWGSLKDHFRELSYEKCWYCETLTHRERGDIDHYRPKGRVTGTAHPGYWWLAFEWRNFRFACSVCNSGSPDLASEEKEKGGKGNHFPLVPLANGEEQRIWAACAYEDHKREDPILLDPTNPDDPGLIKFAGDGKPYPAAKDKTSIEYLRADRSIKIYQLDHSRTNRRRRREIYIPMRDLIERIQRDKLELAKDRSNSVLREKIENDLATLRRMLAPQAEYSSAANAYLRRYRRWSWVDRLSTGSR